MKNIGKLIVVTLGVLLSFTACDLDLEPDTSLPGEEITAEDLAAIRAGVYSGIKTITSGGYLYYADYQTDLFNETRNSGNRGGYFSRWTLYPSDQDVTAMWETYYALINRINYSLEKFALFLEDEAHADDVKLYMAEMYFFRAYTLHQLALRFCEDYDPNGAATQLGVPCPIEYDPDAKLSRGTLKDTYEQILGDVQKAESVLGQIEGEADNIYLSADAVTAFKAQVALQMHDYAHASEYASSLYAAYPLVETATDLEKMWREDISSETIFQPEVKMTSITTVGSMSDYYIGSWNASIGAFLCTPAYTVEDWAAKLFGDDDIRRGIYVSKSYVYYSGEVLSGDLLTKFVGNKVFQSSKTIYSYRNMPKIFRVAEMYLIDAEAQYRNNGDALTPLNALRQSRGLAALESTVTGDELFQAIKDERARETIGEGHRLTDLKRWGDGIVRDSQASLVSFVRTNILFERPAGMYMFVWPIPQEEFANNPNIGKQNPGYLQ